MTTLKILSLSPHGTSLWLHHFLVCTVPCTVCCLIQYPHLTLGCGQCWGKALFATVPPVSLRSRT